MWGLDRSIPSYQNIASEIDKAHESFQSDCERDTVIQNFSKLQRKKCATRSSAWSFARTAPLFPCSALLASPARSAALTRSLACSLTRS